MLGTACLSTQCTVDKVISYTTSTALATSPGTSTLHRLCTSLPHFGIHHPLPISTWHLQCKQQHSVSLKHCCQARDGRKQQHPPNLLPPTHAHCIKCPNAVSQHHHQTWQAKKHTPPQPWPACSPPSQARAEEYRIIDTEYFEKQLNGSYQGMWIRLYKRHVPIWVRVQFPEWHYLCSVNSLLFKRLLTVHICTNVFMLHSFQVNNIGFLLLIIHEPFCPIIMKF